MTSEILSLSNLKDIIIAIAAFTGMGLGLYNLWSEKQKDKVRLEVIPKSIKRTGVDASGERFVLTTANEFNFSQDIEHYAVEIINNSKFDITVDEIGFLNSKTNGRDTIHKPITMDSGKWPRKLTPRESITVYADIQSIFNIKHLPFVTSVFAKTSCKHTETGSSNSLEQLVLYAKNKADSSFTSLTK